MSAITFYQHLIFCILYIPNTFLQMHDNEIVALLRLQKLPHIGSINAKKLIAYAGSPSAVFSVKVKELSSIEGIGTFSLQELHHSRYKEAAEREYQYIQREAIRVYCYNKPDYPYFLRHCPDAPLLLFARGNIQLEGHKMLSVVGTRQCTNRGKAFCRELVEAIKHYNPVIVSGMAYGIDISVQEAAAKAGLQTIGCLAHGLDAMYPPSHREQAKLIERNGGMVTEFWSGTIPERPNFLKRNRIIAGLSQATLVVESAAQGGALVTADIAMGYNRDVFALPGRPGDLASQGCNNLIKSHKAQMITTPDDLITMLNWDLSEKPVKNVQKELFVELDQEEQRIYSYLNKEGKQDLDQIALDCSLPVFKTSSTLLNMEMKGVIRPLPGKIFEII